MVVQNERGYHCMSCKNAELLVSSCLEAANSLCNVQILAKKPHSPPVPVCGFLVVVGFFWWRGVELCV